MKRSARKHSKATRAAPPPADAPAPHPATPEPVAETAVSKPSPDGPKSVVQALLGRDPLLFFAIALGILVLGLMLRPAARLVIEPSVRSVANALIRDTTFGSGAHVWFTEANPKDKPANRQDTLWDLYAWIKNDSNGGTGRRLFSSTRGFYTPDCAYFAFTLALPRLSFDRRKLLALLFGFVALQATLFAGLLLALVEDMSDPSSPLKVYDFDRFTLDVIHSTVGTLEHRFGTAYLLALVFWLLAIVAGNLRRPRPRVLRISAG